MFATPTLWPHFVDAFSGNPEDFPIASHVPEAAGESNKPAKDVESLVSVFGKLGHLKNPGRATELENGLYETLAVLSAGRKPLTATQSGQGTFVVDGKTLTKGGKPLTFHGVTMTAFDSGVVFEGRNDIDESNPASSPSKTGNGKNPSDGRVKSTATRKGEKLRIFGSSLNLIPHLAALFVCFLP